MSGMLKLLGHFIGDAWFCSCGGELHVFFLTAPDTIERYSTWSIAHAVSLDGVDWKYLGIVLEPGKDGEWDEKGLATGCIFFDGDQFVMAYTGRHRAEIGVAYSDDLHCWEKSTDGPITALDERYYESVGSGLRQTRHWRDPFILKHDGYWYQLCCASSLTAPEGVRGAVGLARTVDLGQWEILPPLDVEPFCQEMECPQLFKRGDYWYLVFSALADQISPLAEEKIGKQNVGWTTYVMMSRHFDGPYMLAPSPRIIPAEWEVQPYACQIVQHLGRDICFGSVWPKKGRDYVTNPLPVRFDSTGIHP